MRTTFKNIVEILDYFKSEDVCKKLLEKQRWPEGPICPHCGNCEKIYITKRGYRCSYNECQKKFSVLFGTIYANTKIKLRLWFAALYICSGHKKGVSSYQLSRDLGVTQKAAWFMLQRIRQLLKEKKQPIMKGEVEVDETYIGGKEKNKHSNKRTKTARGRSNSKKKPVFGMKERGGKVIVMPVINTQAETLVPIILDNVKQGAQVYSDEWRAYWHLQHLYKHSIVRHKQKEYTNGKASTNGLENFWSHLKRGITGVYHHASHKHLHRYCDEFAYRYNTRQMTDADRFIQLLTKLDNTQLTYKQLTQ